MDLEEKVNNLAVNVAENSTEIKELKKVQEKQQDEIENFQKFAVSIEAVQEARDKGLNRLLILVTIISAVMPWIAKLF